MNSYVLLLDNNSYARVNKISYDSYQITSSSSVNTATLFEEQDKDAFVKGIMEGTDVAGRTIVCDYTLQRPMDVTPYRDTLIKSGIHVFESTKRIQNTNVVASNDTFNLVEYPDSYIVVDTTKPHRSPMHIPKDVYQFLTTTLPTKKV